MSPEFRNLEGSRFHTRLLSRKYTLQWETFVASVSLTSSLENHTLRSAASLQTKPSAGPARRTPAVTDRRHASSSLFVTRSVEYVGQDIQVQLFLTHRNESRCVNGEDKSNSQRQNRDWRQRAT
jgi:hypothetical protein